MKKPFLSYKETSCNHCGINHDEMLDRCPNCLHDNDDRPLTRKNMTYLPVRKQGYLVLIGLFGLYILSFILSMIFSRLMGTLDALIFTQSLTYLITIIPLFILIFRYLPDLFKRIKIPKNILMGVLLGLATIGINFGLSQLGGLAGTGGNQGTIVVLTKSYPAIMIIITCIVGPLLEEIVFRLGLFNLLMRTRPWFAYLITSLLFGLMHFDFSNPNLLIELANLPSYIFGGVAFAFIYHFYGFGASVIAHSVNNIFSVVLIFIL